MRICLAAPARSERTVVFLRIKTVSDAQTIWVQDLLKSYHDNDIEEASNAEQESFFNLHISLRSLLEHAETGFVQSNSAVSTIVDNV